MRAVSTTEAAVVSIDYVEAGEVVTDLRAVGTTCL